MKKKLGIALIIICTILCVYSGINIRKNNVINYEKIENNDGYMFRTSNNNIIVVDGGNEENAQKLENDIMENGGVVNVWFITNASEKNFGALEKILENGNIKIDYIYKSFNEIDWYEKNESGESSRIKEFIGKLEKYNGKIQIAEMPLGYEFSIDELNFKIISVKNPGSNKKSDQKMNICVDNIFRGLNI